MTNPGEDAAQTASSASSSETSEPASGGYEAPPIEQSQEQPAQPPDDAGDTAGNRAAQLHTAAGVQHPERAAVGLRDAGLSACVWLSATRLPAAPVHAPAQLSAARCARLCAAALPRPLQLRHAVVPASAVRHAAARVRPTPGRLPGSELRRRVRPAHAEDQFPRDRVAGGVRHRDPAVCLWTRLNHRHRAGRGRAESDQDVR